MKPLLVQLRLKMKIYFKKNNNVPSGEGGEDETLTFLYILFLGGLGFHPHHLTIPIFQIMFLIVIYNCRFAQHYVSLIY